MTSLKKNLLLLAATLGILLSPAQLIRLHHPWTCFPMTWDESFFAQASFNWGQGRGYRMNWDTRPFNPAITVGIPMAWGSNAIHRLTGEDIARSGRIFVYATFILATLVLLRTALILKHQWVAVPMAAGIFGYGVSKLPVGDFFVFGFLGEGPALLFAALAFLCIARKRHFLAGLLCVATFAMKPTFVLLMPAIVLAALFRSKRFGLLSGAATASAFCAWLVGICIARGESVLEYARSFYGFGSLISQGESLWKFFANAGVITSSLGLGFLGLGAYSFFRNRKDSRILPSHAAFIFFILSIAQAILGGHGVVVKQWSAICCVTLLGFSADWANLIADRIRSWWPDEQVREVFLAVTFTWFFSVGSDALHYYKRQPAYGCPGKEQSLVQARIQALSAAGAASEANLLLVSHDQPMSNFLYGLGWEPKQLQDWKTLPTPLPRWVAGQITRTDRLPSSCRADTVGEVFSLYECL